MKLKLQNLNETPFTLNDLKSRFNQEDGTLDLTDTYIRARLLQSITGEEIYENDVVVDIESGESITASVLTIDKVFKAVKNDMYSDDILNGL